MEALKALISSFHLFFTKFLLSSETNLSTSHPADLVPVEVAVQAINEVVINVDSRDVDDPQYDQQQSAATSDCGKTIMQLCFAASIAFLGISFQIQSPHIYLSFRLLFLFVLGAFSTSLGGVILLRLKRPLVAKVLENMGVICCAVAFFLAMGISISRHSMNL